MYLRLAVDVKQAGSPPAQARCELEDTTQTPRMSDMSSIKPWSHVASPATL